MKRILILLCSGVVLAGCSSLDGYFVVFPDEDDVEKCEGPAAHAINIEYGDSKIVVDHKLKVKKREVIEIKLDPDKKSFESGVNYETLDIMLVGKASKSQWLNRKLRASESQNNKFRICVGERPKDTYYYMVEVPGVGKIDPRVDIED